MRDTHRMREKFDLSLDSRQVVSLLIGAIVVLGAVFVLGVLVGKKLAGTQQPDRAPDLLAALDHRSEALEKARASPPLTFQEELTRTTPDEKHAPPAAKPTPAAAPAKAAAVTPAAVAPPAKSPPAASAVASAAKPAPAATPSEDRTRPAEAVSPASEAKTSETITARATPTAAKPAPKPPEATTANGAFTLQLGSSPNREDAERQASRLREKGYAPYIVSAEVPGKGTWYRVRMGSFPTKDAATRYLQDFKRETQSEAFVASTQ